MSYDPVVREHQEWLGFLQPEGLVVSPAALRNAQARVARNVLREQEILLSHTREVLDEEGHKKRQLNGLRNFAQHFWTWEEADLPAPPEELSTALQEYGEILRPTYAVPGVRGEGPWQILVQELPPSTALDRASDSADERAWKASPQIRFERLLRDTNVPVGLLVNADAIRLIYAPRGETAGHITFPIQAMCETAGRPIVAALHLLLNAQRLFALPKDQRLPAILQASRRYQNEVSTKLAEQVLRALAELCRGLNEANRATKGALLAETLEKAPSEVYGGLLTSLMRMVFLLYAEDRNLMASGETYQTSYSLIGLHEKLRADAAAYPDTIDQRFGAWAQFLTLSRIVHDGGGHADWRLPARRGRLFDPDCYPFLEGRAYRSKRNRHELIIPPKVSDGVLYRILEDLLYLSGERISYRALDVEQIGSVYEAMMGFEVKQATGLTIGFKPDHVVLNLSELLAKKEVERKKWLKEKLGWEPSEKAAEELKAASSAAELMSALQSRVSPLYGDRERGTLPIHNGDIFLQPTEERRRSGSHYTPRTLTQPIVKTTLDPVLQQLGDNPTPAQILNLKVCDPAMGSGAFLVEACRYLGEALTRAWIAHNSMPEIPADQDPLLHARRVVAQRCLYGVDKNPFAVDLAKLSLWLATFAKDHPFTFLDHSLRHGDSLVGLSIADMVDALAEKDTLFRAEAEKQVATVIEARRALLDQIEHTEYSNLETHYANAVFAARNLRDLGDVIVAAFFAEDRARARTARLNELLDAYEHKKLDRLAGAIQNLRAHLTPFHWEVEFPEVFRDGGFSAFVGNPPFAGKNTLIASNGEGYLDWLLSQFEGSHGNADLVAYFFRRAFSCLRQNGCLGLIATNTIGQGDTRATGLQWIRHVGGTIYAATRRLAWPGRAAVVVSIVHVSRGPGTSKANLNGNEVPLITSYLFHAGNDDDPARLFENQGKSFQGSTVLGMGFTFDDSNLDRGASPISLMNELIAKDAANADRIFPYLGGEETNDDPVHAYKRYVINFEDFPLRRLRDGKAWKKLSEKEQKDQIREGIVAPDYPFPVASDWPDLLRIVELNVKGSRASHSTAKWWHFERARLDLYRQLESGSLCFALSRVSSALAVAALGKRIVFAESMVVFASDRWSFFAILQSRAHEIWARFFGSSMKDDLRYTPTDCFETFAFPEGWKANPTLEEIGEQYYRFRADLMLRNNEGLTKTYNRFHDKYETSTDIQKLRDLHAGMDRAVLNAYGWKDLTPTHEFILDYEEPEDLLDSGKVRKRKEPWRYRWPDEFRDEVLARLLELNRVRAEQERTAAVAVGPKTSRKAAPPKKTALKTMAAGQTLLDLGGNE